MDAPWYLGEIGSIHFWRVTIKNLKFKPLRSNKLTIFFSIIGLHYRYSQPDLWAIKRFLNFIIIQIDKKLPDHTKWFSYPIYYICIFIQVISTLITVIFLFWQEVLEGHFLFMELSPLLRYGVSLLYFDWVYVTYSLYIDRIFSSFSIREGSTFNPSLLFGRIC